MILRPYQQDIINQAREYMRTGFRRILIQSPTGSGKTVLVAHMLKTAASRGMGSWFIVHRRELIDQSCKIFDMLNIPYDIVAAGYNDYDNSKIKICSIQTLIRRLEKYQKPELIVWDECHHVASRSWSSVHNYLSDKYHIGLTATPVRLDGKGLKKWFDVIVNGPPVEQLTNDGYLSNYKIFSASKIDASGVKKMCGDFKKSDLNQVANTKTVAGDAIKEYKRLANGKQAVVFCCSVDHSAEISRRFNEAQISAVHVDGDTKKEIRDAALSDFKKGTIKVLSNCELFGEGLDIPGIEVAILLRPTQSLGLYMQQIGRALRPVDGKEHAIILDHAGNAERHGFPDDEIIWTLDGIEKKDKKQILTKMCKSCYAVQKIHRKTCIECGEEFPKKPVIVEEKKGDLVELKRESKERRMRQGKARSINDLIEIGRQRGYKNPHGWAKHVYNARKRKYGGF